MYDVYNIITNRIIDLLEKGTVPWQRPWGGPKQHPKNLSSGRPYRGINVFMLNSAGYASPYWISFNQAKERGGYVQKGQKGWPCIFWKWYEKTDEKTGEVTKSPFLRHYTVFNVEQCENVDYPTIEYPNPGHKSNDLCERLVSGMPNPPKMEWGGTQACYNPFNDTVSMPKPEWFKRAENYYSVLFHELTHSTGHKTRLNRKGVTDTIVFGSQTYGKEELVAEMGATYLCGYAGIENVVMETSASYIDAWLKKIRGNNRLVVQAAAHAQRSTDYILGAVNSEEYESET